MSTCNMYSLRDLHFTPSQQCDLSVRFDNDYPRQWRQYIHYCLSVCVHICEQDNTKCCGWIWINFCGSMGAVKFGTNHHWRGRFL